MRSIARCDADVDLRPARCRTARRWTASRCCASCAERGSVVPVIMLTARTSTRDTVEGLDAGANDYMPKPFKFDELLARIRSRLRESAQPAIDLARPRRRHARRPRPPGDGRGPRGRAVGAGVRARRAVPAQPRPGAQPRAAAEPRVGTGLRPGLQRRRRLRAVPARQVRRSTTSRPCAAPATAGSESGIPAAHPGTKKPPALGDAGGWGGARSWGTPAASIAAVGGWRRLLSLRSDRTEGIVRISVPAFAGVCGAVRLLIDPCPLLGLQRRSSARCAADQPWRSQRESYDVGARHPDDVRCRAAGAGARPPGRRQGRGAEHRRLGADDRDAGWATSGALRSVAGADVTACRTGSRARVDAGGDPEHRRAQRCCSG